LELFGELGDKAVKGRMHQIHDIHTERMKALSALLLLVEKEPAQSKPESGL